MIPSDTPTEVTGALIRGGARVWVQVDMPEHRPGEADRTQGLAGVWLHLSDGLPPEAAVFQIRSAATALRASAPDRSIGVVLSNSLATTDAARAIRADIDAVWIPAASSLTADVVQTRFPGLTLVQETTNDDVLAPQPARVDARVLRARGDIVRTIRLTAALREWLPPGLATLDAVTVDCDGCHSDVWLHPDTLDAIAVVTSSAGPSSLRVLPTAMHVTAIDPEMPETARALPLTSLATGVVAALDGSSGRTGHFGLPAGEARRSLSIVRASKCRPGGRSR